MSPVTIFTSSFVGVSEASWLAVIEVDPIDSLNPGRKPLPLMVRVWPEFEPVMGFGFKVVIAGATTGAFTVRLTASVAWPLGLVTFTDRVWAPAPTLTLTTSCELLTKLICEPE